jgi:cytochrome P450
VRNYRKGGPFWDSVRGLMGNGLPVSEGDFWRRQRRMMQPHFHHERLATMADRMIDAIDDQMADWDRAAATGEPFDVARALMHVTLKVIVATMFGSIISVTEADAVGEEMGYAIDYMLRATVTSSLPAWLPMSGRERFRRSVRRIDEVLSSVIARRRGAGGGGELLGMLLDMVDAETGERMNDQQLRDEAIAIFLAGYETTAATLAWTFHFLTQQADLLVPVQEEVDLLSGRRPTFADLPHQVRTLAALQESLRLRPTVYWLPRIAVDDDEIDGFHVPGGTFVGVMIYAIHRHPALWEEPDRFDPRRFSPERSQGRPALSWLPFGAGPRGCIGKDFALIEAQLILTRVLQRYQIEAVPGRKAELHVGTTLRPADGVWLRLRRRAAAG